MIDPQDLPPVERAALYRARANEARRFGKIAKSSKLRADYESLAAAWDSMADDLERELARKKWLE